MRVPAVDRLVEDKNGTCVQHKIRLAGIDASEKGQAFGT
jgi:micrococcal nuclease